MASTFRLQTSWRLAAFVLVAISCALCITYVHVWRVEVPSSNVHEPSLTPVADFVSTNSVDASIWAVFSGSKASPGGAGALILSERFRMAGSFAIESEAGLRLQKAILDDTLKNEQRVVGEGDIIGDIVVEDIRYDRMSLRSPSGVRVLVMEFVSSPISPEAQGTNNLSSSSDKSISNRFGCVKVQDDRWQFGRQQMLDYYQELLDEPDRMVALFDTMKPVRDDRNRITGYVVGVEGERDFFDAVGLREGDIVRQVNSVAMTNRRRAEFFIDEFLKSRMSAIVLEVERDGKIQKQIYQVKE